MACEYSTKFIPLIVAKATEFENNSEGLKSWFVNSFVNGSNLYNRYISGTLFNEKGASKPVKVVNRPYFGRFNQDTTYDVISDYFRRADDLQIRAEYSFKNEIVKRIIFDRTADNVYDRWKNPTGINEETGISNVNEAIAKYKEDLLNAILSEIDPETKVELTPNLTDSQFNKIIQDILAKYRQFLGTNPEVAEQYIPFVILSTFDEYLKAYAPFITPKDEFVDDVTGRTKSTDSFDKYVYHGPSVQHYTGYTSSEFAAIENQDSDLAKLLLDTMPDLNENGDVIEGSFIGLSGFNASMMAMKNWILYEAPIEIRQELRKQNTADFSKIIDAYLDRNKKLGSSVRNIYSDTSTFLNGKLKSIKRFIFDEEADELIKAMFINMALKTEPISYRTYSYDQETKQITGSNLRSSFINAQKFNLEDLIRSTAYLIKTSSSYKTNLTSKYKFNSVNGGVEIIDQDNPDNKIIVNLSKRTNGPVEGSFIGEASDEFKKQLISDLLLFIVPDTYVEVGQSMESNPNWADNWANDFAPFIGIVANLIQNRTNMAINWDRDNMLNLRDYTKATLNVAKKLSVIYGSETRNVVKNLSGSNLPMYQLSNLSYNLPNVIDDIIESIEEYNDNLVDDNLENANLIPKRIANQNNLFVQARQLLIAPQVRQEVQYGDLIKPASKLTIKELLELNVLHDFYEGFSSSTDNPAYGKIYLQSATYADKSTHYLFGYDLNQEIYIDGEKINLFEIIKKIINGESDSSRLMEITRNIRASRINNIVSNIVADYNDVFASNGETLFNSIEEVSNFLKGKNYENILNAFKEKGVNFIEEVHGCKPKYKNAPSIELNETMLNYYKTFNDPKLFEQRLNKARESFIKSIDDNYWTWNKYDNPTLDDIYKSKKYERFKGLNGDIKTHIGSQLHPILEAYFMSDVLLSNEVNSLLIGEVWMHPNKNKRQTNIRNINSSSKTTFTESSGNYAVRTKENANWSDITLAFATNYNTAGERLTKNVSGSKYIQSPLSDSISYKEAANNIVVEIETKKLPKTNIKLNIAGNGIYSLNKSQQEINDYITNVIRELQNSGITISEIRSGGQTGIDEAGIIAAQRLGIKNSVHAPKNWTFRGKNGVDVSDENSFKARFVQSFSVNPSDIYSDLGTKTKSKNVVITSWSNLKDFTSPFDSNGNIISTRLKSDSIESFGNTFTPEERLVRQGMTKVNTVREAVEAYINAVLTSNDPHYEWIRNQCKSGNLKGKTIFYYSELGEPSHATALDYLINTFNWDLLNDVNFNPNEEEGTYEEFSEANRLIAQIKRSVAFGATYHPYLQNLDNGVPPEIRIAVIQDIPGIVFTPNGDQKIDLDSSDGSGIAHPLQSRFENNSLVDARVGRNKKSIMMDIDPYYGKPTLLKWAVYELSNENRRNGILSKANLENIYKKMSDGMLDIYEDELNDYLKNKPVYFKDYKSGKYYKILSFEHTDENELNSNWDENIYETTRHIIEVNPKTLETVGSVESQNINLWSLYDVDQALGGAWTGEFNNGIWEYNEIQLDIIEDYISKIVDNDAKQDLYIGYLVNKSAIKVGAGNVNSVSAWNDNSAFSTIKMKTKYGGVQMDADHELDMAEVTEMTQMISALIEDGHYKDVVESIYQDIGGVVASHIAKLSTAVKNVLNNGNAKSKQELYEILAKSWIESFETKSKDTIGIAQAFVKKASDAFRKGNSNIKIPFSAATINGSFVADVISSINKGGIRHKYEGFAGVLNPSHDMIEYFRVFNNGQWEVRLFDEFMDFIKSNENWNVTFDDINSIYLDNVLTGATLNPLLQSIEHNKIDFEDTVVVFDENGNVINSSDELEPQFWYVNSFTTYDDLKALLRNNPNYKTYVHTGKPRNLKATNTKFTINGKEYSIYDLDSVRASQYLTRSLKNGIDSLSEDQINIIKRVLGWRFNINSAKVDKSHIVNLIKLSNNKTQDILKCIESGKQFEASEAFGIDNLKIDINGIDIQLDPIRSMLSKFGTRKVINQESLINKLNTIIASEKGIKTNIAEWIKSILVDQSRLINKPIGLSNNIDSMIAEVLNLNKNSERLRNKYVTYQDETMLLNVIKAEYEAKEALDELIDRVCNTVFDIQPDYVLRKISNAEPTQSLLVYATSYNVEPAEMIAGRYQWDKFGLGMDDHIFDIKSSKYFYDKLQSKYNTWPEFVESDLFDGVLFGNNEQFLFKIGDIPSELAGQLSESTDFRIIENEAYYKGINIGSSENKKFFIYVDENGNKHHIIQLKTNDDFMNLKKSSLFDNVIRYNWTESNFNNLKRLKFNGEGIKLYTSPKRWNLVDFDSVTLDQLKTDEEFRLEKRISNQAKDMYDSFKRQLNFIGARIPTQAMQSFMAMNLIAATKAKENVVYVPKSQTYLEGSDYDIDKLYILTHSVNSNGLVQTGTSIQSKYGLDFVSKLSRPENKIIELSNIPDNATIISQDFIEKFEFNDLDSEDIIRVYNNALYTGKLFIEPYVNDGFISEKVYKRTYNKILKEIQDYSNSTLSSNSDPNYLKNRVVSGIWNVTTKLQNQLIAQIPVDMGDPQKAAEQSTLGRAELHINSDDPSAKMMMQQQNAVGKEVIGISAVSLKAFFGLYYYYSELTDELKQACLKSDVNAIINTIDKLTFIHPITRKITSLANIDIEQVIDVIRENQELKTIDLSNIELNSKLVNSGYYNDITKQFDLLNFCKYLQEEVNKVDAALTDSALISAATDNAKELILAKINATPELVDIYTYLTSIGTPFLDIADFMTSKSFGFITKAGEVNVFDSSSHHRKVKKAIDWFLGKDMLSGFDRMIMEQVLGLWYQNQHTGQISHASNEQFIKAFNNKDKVINALNSLQSYLNSSSYATGSGDEMSWEFNNKLLGVNNIDPVDIRNCIKVLEWQLSLFNFKSNLENRKEEIDKLERIAGIISNVEEMSTMGAAQGINQGQRTNLYANRGFINRLNKFINNKLKKLEITDAFDFDQFVSNAQYRNEWIEKYDKIKDTFNILEALTRLPHFWEMLKTTITSKNAIKESSWRDRTIWNLADSIESTGGYISEDDWKNLDYYINDYIIASFLKSNDLKFKLPVGVNYYSGMSSEGKLENKVNGYEISLNSIIGIASFKRLVEEYIIPYLKSNFKYSDNRFISNLIPYANVSFDKVVTGWKLPLDMMNIDSSPNTKLLFANILSDFDSIANQTEFGMKLGDIFYLYNLIVNKDGYGRSSLTRLFENTINSDDVESLAYKFNNFVSKLDSGENELNLNVSEAVYRMKKANPNFNGKSDLSHNFKTPSDFTLDLPMFFDLPIKTDHKRNAAEMKTRTINLDSSDAILAIAQAIASKYDDSVEIVTDDDLINEQPIVRNAKAFIKNGKMFININSAKASDALHELAHIVLASMKFSDNDSIRKTYYNLVASTRDQNIISKDKFDSIAKAYVGEDGLITSDVLEEVLANEFAYYLSGELLSETHKLIDVNSENAILNAIANTLELSKAPTLDQIQGKSLGDIMRALGRNILMANKISSSFITRTQKVSKIEDQLYREQKLTCK